MNQRTITVIFLMLFAAFGHAQDPVYSQFYNSPMIMNPAFAGNTHGPFATISYRNQWPQFNNAYETFSLTYDQEWNETSGLGLYINSDNAGDGTLRTTKLGGVYSYRIRIVDDVYVKGALDAAYGNTRLDPTKLVFLDNLDPQFGLQTPGGMTFPTEEIINDNATANYFDLSTGILLYSSRFYGGLTLKHLNSPTIDYIDDETGNRGDMPLFWSLQGGMQINFDGSYNNDKYGTFISPNILFAKQKDFWQVNVGAYVNVSQVFGGLWYRHAATNTDAVIASVGVHSGVFKISYSYDYTVSILTNGSGGAHEI